jgi:hypothetical protein
MLKQRCPTETGRAVHMCKSACRTKQPFVNVEVNEYLVSAIRTSIIQVRIFIRQYNYGKMHENLLKQ